MEHGHIGHHGALVLYVEHLVNKLEKDLALSQNQVELELIVKVMQMKQEHVYQQ